MGLFGDIERWIAYRTYDKYHVIRVDGMGYRYTDKDNQMLGAMFGLLVDFVEVELACQHWIWRWYSEKNTRWDFWKRLWERLTPWHKSRSREAGLAYLDWATQAVYDENCGCDPGTYKYGKPTSHAKACKRIKELYLWWVDERPKRIEWWTVQPHSEANKIEDQQEKEDQAMLHKLINVRGWLWT